MEIKLEKLINLQCYLDKIIGLNIIYNDVNNNQVLKNKLLAFIVELGELANETRCFKYWSQKKPSSKKIIAEEYADGLHFLLSIGLSLDIIPKKIIISNNLKKLHKNDLVKKFMQLINLSTHYFQDLNNKDKFDLILKKYLSLAFWIRNE